MVRGKTLLVSFLIDLQILLQTCSKNIKIQNQPKIGYNLTFGDFFLKLTDNVLHKFGVLRCYQKAIIHSNSVYYSLLLIHCYFLVL